MGVLQIKAVICQEKLMDMNFKEYLKSKENVYGAFTKTNDPFFVEIMGKAGFDFVILDNEHGPSSPRDTYPLVMASYLSGMYPIVRVPSLNDIEIQRILDLGVAGVEIPQIRNKADALKVGEYTRFDPKGKRGLCRFVRAADFSLKVPDTFFREQNEVTTIIHLEGTEAVRNLEEILEVDEIDILFIGPYDLSQSLGMPGKVTDPVVLREIERVVKICKERKRDMGIFADTMETAKMYKEAGVKYISYSVDVGIFANACKEIASKLKEL